MLRRSRGCDAFVVAGAVVTIALLFAVSLPSWARWAGVAWCCGAAAWAWKSSGRYAGSLIQLGTDRRISVTDVAGRTRCGHVLDATYVTGWFTAVIWCEDGRRIAHTIAVLPDAMDAEERRRLRVYLRYGREPASGEPPESEVALPGGISGVVAASPRSQAEASTSTPLSTFG